MELTRHRAEESPIVAPEGRPPEMVLATDLDGTFLGGSPADRRCLYDWFLEAPKARALIYVTGRGLESVVPLLSDPLLPTPGFVICDVGATVVHGATGRPVQPIQSQIEHRWPGAHAVRGALERFGLQPQDVPQERRASFLVDSPDAVGPELRAAVEALDCELLLSAGCYLDVLPKGVSKGATLMALLQHLGIPIDRVAVAGDTLNDESLYRVGLKGIVVGEAEPALVSSVSGLSEVYIAERPGAGGILEGLDRHGMRPAESEREVETVQGSSQLVMVYHRLPFEEVRRKGKIHRRPHQSPNGIIPTLLGFFGEGRPGSWVAWSEAESRSPPAHERHVRVDANRYPELNVARVPLTKDDVQRFYKTFSKEAFWPVIFSFPGRAVFRQKDWKHFVEINQIFAEHTAREARPGAIVWIHDYNLWMVPAYLRRLRPDLKIAFFHHTAFPPADIFNIIPWAREIVHSLIQCDYVGFHIPRYVRNFVDLVRSHVEAHEEGDVLSSPRFKTYGCAMGVDSTPSALRISGRRVGVGAHPVGIDVDLIRRILAEEETQARIAEIKEELSGRRCILSVERLDYVKGPIGKLQAFEKLLEDHPELHEKVVLVTVTTPAAPGMEVYRTTRKHVDQLVGQINGRFSSVTWTPVRYFYRSLSFREVIAWYAAADIAWITPLRDGLNLVAKEYVAAQAAHGGSGVLVLSQFAGAAVELHGALLTNPYDAADMQQGLLAALSLNERERRLAIERIAAIVESNDVAAWGAEFLGAVRSLDE